jgi:hypothetical protein
MKLEKNQFKKLFVVKKTIKRMRIKSDMTKKIKGEWNCKKLINFKKLSQIKQITIKMGIKCDIWKKLEDEMEKKNAIL